MESYTSSQDLATTARPSRADGIWQRYGALAYLRGRRGLLLVAAALGIVGILVGWTLFGTAAVLPLLRILPCAAMMAMCMRGHGGSANAPTKSGSGTGSEPDLTQ
jgi:hypothetical protein